MLTIAMVVALLLTVCTSAQVTEKRFKLHSGNSSEFIFFFTDYCKNPMVLAPAPYSLTYGTYLVPPAPQVPSYYSSQFTYGFQVMENVTNGKINGQLAYNCPGCGQWPAGIPMQLMFAYDQGSWEIETVYWTPLQCETIEANIGNIYLVNIVVGFSDWLPPC